MQKIGILVNNFGPTQLAYCCIKNLNEFISNNQLDYSPIGFYEQLYPTCLPTLFATMHINEIYGYSANLITTDLNTTVKAVNSFGRKKIYFYVWDLEWVRMKQKNYLSLMPIYNNPEVELISRSKEHYDLIENCWNKKPIAIVEDFHCGKLFNVVGR